MNRLYYGDNLDVLRDQIGECAGADASIEAFDDTWTWGEASKNAQLDIASGTNRPLRVIKPNRNRRHLRQGRG